MGWRTCERVQLSLSTLLSLSSRSSFDRAPTFLKEFPPSLNRKVFFSPVILQSTQSQCHCAHCQSCQAFVWYRTAASQQLPLKLDNNPQNVPDHIHQTKISADNSSYIAEKAFFFFFSSNFQQFFFNFPVCCAAGLKVNIRLSHCQNRNISALVSLKISCGVKRWMPSFKVEWIFIAKL